MGRYRVTIKDVAKIAGVSLQTVSRVVNEKAGVAEDTRKRVHDVIRRLGYRPNPIARSMKGQTMTLGCIIPPLSEHVYSKIIPAIESEAYENGYFLFTGIVATENKIKAMIEEMTDRRVDGLLMIKPNDDGRSRYLVPLIEQGIPIVYLGSTPVEEEVPAVLINDELGGYLAAQYLLDLNYETIVLIEGPLNEESSRKIYAGFSKALKEKGVEPDPGLILRGEWTAESGYHKMSRLLTESKNFSAVIAQSDQMALGAIFALKEAGVSVPKDISIVGYGNTPMCKYLDPPLTTIDTPIEQLGRTGVRLLLEQINTKRSPNQIIKLDPVLIERKSCKMRR